MPSNFYRYYLDLLACPVQQPTFVMSANPQCSLENVGNLQILVLRSFKEMETSCINSVLKFLTLTSNEEGSRFLLKSYSFVREIKAYFLNLCTSLIKEGKL